MNGGFRRIVKHINKIERIKINEKVEKQTRAHLKTELLT